MAGKAGGKPSGGGGSGGGFGGAVRSVGSRGASYITASQGRQTAFLLIMAIFFARLALTNQLQAFWAAMWGQSRPLGAALPKNAAAANSQQANNSTQTTQAQTPINTAPGTTTANASGGLASLKAGISKLFGGKA